MNKLNKHDTVIEQADTLLNKFHNNYKKFSTPENFIILNKISFYLLMAGICFNTFGNFMNNNFFSPDDLALVEHFKHSKEVLLNIDLKNLIDRTNDSDIFKYLLNKSQSKDLFTYISDGFKGNLLNNYDNLAGIGLGLILSSVSISVTIFLSNSFTYLKNIISPPPIIKKSKQELLEEYILSVPEENILSLNKDLLHKLRNEQPSSPKSSITKTI